MLLLDMLLSLVIVLWLTVGPEEFTPGRILLTLSGGVALIVVFHYAVGWALNRMVTFWFAMGKPRLANRRRMMQATVYKNREEERLEEMDDDALAAYVEHYPRDALAVEIHCERLERAGRWADYAREMEYLLTLTRDLTKEEICNRYNRLADLYLNRLNRPERAREMLQAIIATFPDHYQATLARRRLAALSARIDGETARPPA